MTGGGKRRRRVAVRKHTLRCVSVAMLCTRPERRPKGSYVSQVFPLIDMCVIFIARAMGYALPPPPPPSHQAMLPPRFKGLYRYPTQLASKLDSTVVFYFTPHPFRSFPVTVQQHGSRQFFHLKS